MLSRLVIFDSLYASQIVREIAGHDYNEESMSRWSTGNVLMPQVAPASVAELHGTDLAVRRAQLPTERNFYSPGTSS